MQPSTEKADLAPGITYQQNFLSAADASNYFRELQAGVAWQQDKVRLFGKEHPIPRLHQWYGDPGCTYRWSGLQMQPLAWIKPLSEIRERVSAACGSPFNSVLVNLYRDGNDSMGWHADDEAELGPEPVIASVSLGAARDFQLRGRAGAGDKLAVTLEGGSLLVMAGRSQHEWQHALPKRRRVSAPRINLTFRRIL